MGTVKRENLIILVCMLFQAVPFFITEYRHYTFTRYYYPHYWQTLFLLLFCIPLLTLVELFSILFLVEGIKDRLEKAKSWLVVLVLKLFLVLMGAFVVVYHLVIAASWYCYSETGWFIGRDTLRLFPILFDFRFVINTFSPPKLVELSVVISASVLIGCWIVVYAPQRSFMSFLHYYGRGMVLAIVIVIAIILPQTNLDPVFSGIYRANSFFGLSPQWSLFWAHLRYGRFEPELPAVSLHLVEQKESRPPAEKNISRKNVFLFVVEALRADIVSQDLTPTLYRLAREGISFNNSYSQSTETSESMLSIITGRYSLKSPLRNRKLGEDKIFHVYDGIAQAGYLTGFFGEEWTEDSILTNSSLLSYRFNPLVADYSKVEARDNPFRYKKRGLGDYSLAVADRLKMKMLQSFVEHGSANRKKVFSIFYFMAPHFPYDQTDGIPALRLPNELNGDYSFLSYPKDSAPVMRNRYMNTIAYIDSLMNSFVLFLKERNLLNDSIIIVTGDHGEQFWEHSRVGHSRHLDQEAIRVPLIIWGANGYASRWGSMFPVGHVDIAPTIYYLLGLPEQLSFQGEPILRHAPTADLGNTPDRPLFMSIQALMHEDAIILWPWKLARNLWGEGLRMYRLDKDPQESKNLFNVNDATAQMLCKCLVGFRAYQLNYYDPLKKLDKRYYPPKYDSCSVIAVDSEATAKFCSQR